VGKGRRSRNGYGWRLRGIVVVNKCNGVIILDRGGLGGSLLSINVTGCDATLLLKKEVRRGGRSEKLTIPISPGPGWLPMIAMYHLVCDISQDFKDDLRFRSNAHLGLRGGLLDKIVEIVGGYQSVGRPRQESDHHAKGYAAGSDKESVTIISCMNQ
jgi:hypothetical protein